MAREGLRSMHTSENQSFKLVSYERVTALSGAIDLFCLTSRTRIEGLSRAHVGYVHNNLSYR